jgi:hypothetical protein
MTMNIHKPIRLIVVRRAWDIQIKRLGVRTIGGRRALVIGLFAIGIRESEQLDREVSTFLRGAAAA